MGWRSVVLFMILALVAGAGGFAWLSSTSTMPWSESPAAVLPEPAEPGPPATAFTVPAFATPVIVQPAASQSDAQLLVMQARRALEAGKGLGTLETALQSRFGQAQPQALAAIVNSARQPLSNAQLLAGFDAIAEELVLPQGTAWERMRLEVNSLFVLRPRDSKPTPMQQRIQIIRDHIIAGEIAAAATAVRKMPGAIKAGDWLVTANRAIAVHQALDSLAQSAAAPAPVLPPVLAPSPISAPALIPAPVPVPDPIVVNPVIPTE